MSPPSMKFTFRLLKGKVPAILNNEWSRSENVTKEVCRLINLKRLFYLNYVKFLLGLGYSNGIFTLRKILHFFFFVVFLSYFTHRKCNKIQHQQLDFVKTYFYTFKDF